MVQASTSVALVEGNRRCGCILPRLTSDWSYASRYRLEIGAFVSRRAAASVTDRPERTSHRDLVSAGGMREAQARTDGPHSGASRGRHSMVSPGAGREGGGRIAPLHDPLRGQKSKKGLVKCPGTHQNRAARPPPCAHDLELHRPRPRSHPPEVGSRQPPSLHLTSAASIAWQVVAASVANGSGETMNTRDRAVPDPTSQPGNVPSDGLPWNARWVTRIRRSTKPGESRGTRSEKRGERVGRGETADA